MHELLELLLLELQLQSLPSCKPCRIPAANCITTAAVSPLMLFPASLLGVGLQQRTCFRHCHVQPCEQRARVY
jgi:hypothetical protein